MKLILTDLLIPLLDPDNRLVVLDIGARDALSDPRWAALRHASIYGFDPDPVEVARLNAEAKAAGVDATYFPVALGAESGRAVFHHNKSSGAGSFLDQNRVLTDRWKFECVDGQKANARDVFQPSHDEVVRAMTLADFAGQMALAPVDFIKMNIQGAELDVLKGAGSVLDDVLGVVSEVAFVESYRGRPLFADIDVFMRGAGFSFFDFILFHHVGRQTSAFTAQHSAKLLGLKFPSRDRVHSPGQLIEAYALYLRDPIDREDMTRSEHIKLICLAEAFGQLEFAFENLAFAAQGNEQITAILDAAVASYNAEYPT